MLSLVISNVQEYVIQISDDWSSSSWLPAGLEIIKHERLGLIVLTCNLWSWKTLKNFSILLNKSIISFISMLFDLL